MDPIGFAVMAGWIAGRIVGKEEELTGWKKTLHVVVGCGSMVGVLGGIFVTLMVVVSYVAPAH